MSPPLLHNLSPSSASIWRAVIAAIRPRGHGFDQPVDEDVLIEIDRTLPHLPRASRVGLSIGLRLLEWVAPLFAARVSRLSRMNREQATACLRRCLDSRVPPLHMLVYGVRALVLVAFYQHPTVLEAMGVHWDRRLVETVRLRARTLGSTRHGDSP